ncbi:DEAD/DEAH box helicase [Telmatospirillum sp. J64-1]|uniref:DEAD/DEAH box helicase n=1 Tax=Telmatospirillum sp. J64-1 TaxID=2502183 RepID=UPI00115EC148|nr:DEAD/DEAH box helicase [Telmatospirillum sp. J64-1]
MTFSELELHPQVIRALELAGYTEPSPVQAAAIPPALAGRDILATAETGTGKTAAFMLPSLTRIADKGRSMPGAPRVLVLAPTRELARQVTDAVRKYGKFLRLNTVDVVGGMPYRDQIRLLSRPVDVVVATPGRLIDHVERERIDLSQVEVLILDEADRMLDMGFLDDVQAIAGACSPDRQTMLFTATLDRRMTALAQRLLNNPERVAVERTATAARIEQRLHLTDDLSHKRKLLHHWASLPEVGKAIVFAATKRDADTLAEELNEAGHAAAALHGDMAQGARNRTLQRLRTGQVRLLVATDVAARGIDVRDISHVINFDLPRSAEDYVHRIGRTGRAGATGVAISFAARSDRETLARIERYTGASMEVHVVPGLEPQRPFGTAPGRPSGRGPRGAGRPNGAGAGKPWVRSARPANDGGRPDRERGRPAGARSEGGRDRHHYEGRERAGARK